MTENNHEAFRAALRKWRDDVETSLGPPPDVLNAYVAGTLTPDEATAVRQQILRSRIAMDRLADVESDAAGPGAGEIAIAIQVRQLAGFVTLEAGPMALAGATDIGQDEPRVESAELGDTTLLLAMSPSDELEAIVTRDGEAVPGVDVRLRIVGPNGASTVKGHQTTDERGRASFGRAEFLGRPAKGWRYVVTATRD